LGAPLCGMAVACVGAESAKRPAAGGVTAWEEETETGLQACARLELPGASPLVAAHSCSAGDTVGLRGRRLSGRAGRSVKPCACRGAGACSLAKDTLTPGATRGGRGRAAKAVLP